MNDFQNDLKNWYILDNKFRDLSLQLNIIKNEKNEIKYKIIEFIQSNNLEKKSIKIDNTQFRFVSQKQIQPLTFKFLKECLDDCIQNSEQVDQLIDYIKSKREIKEFLDLKKLNL
jgi:hypothetical protein